MAFARARAARTLQYSLRRAIPRVSAPGRQLVQRRWASEGGHGHAEPSSDLPWALGAVIVTIPSCWYLWPDSSDAGHHGHDEEHGEEHEEGGDEGGEEAAEEGSEEAKANSSEEEPKDEESGPVDEAKPDTEQEQQEEEKADERKVDAEERKENGQEGQKQTAERKKDDDKPTKTEANDPSGAEEVRVQKDRVVRKTLPSSGQPLGKSPQQDENEGEAKGSGGSMGSKQAGVSNTQAKHSIPIGDSPDKSKKPEGGPDTAKASGTVAVKRHD